MKEKVTLDEISYIIKGFLFDNYLFGYDEGDFGSDTSFMEYGVLDSLGVFELITFLENSFHIEIVEADILPENLDTISGVSRLVSRKMGAAAEVV